MSEERPVNGEVRVTVERDLRFVACTFTEPLTFRIEGQVLGGPFLRRLRNAWRVLWRGEIERRPIVVSGCVFQSDKGGISIETALHTGEIVHGDGRKVSEER